MPADDPNNYAEIRRLDDEAKFQAMRERWYRSVEAGYNVGDSAIRAWIRIHWSGFFRACWVQHLTGECCWADLPCEEYGLLRRDFGDRQPIVDAIIEMLRLGAENLNFMCWSRSRPAAELPHIFAVLELIDINGHRVRCSFDNS